MIPTAVLPQVATIEPYEGTTGTGEQSFGAPIPMPCRRVAKRRVVRSDGAVQVIAESTCLIRPRVVPAESRVTIDGWTYGVLGVNDLDELGRPHATELLLSGPLAPQDGPGEPATTAVLDGGDVDGYGAELTMDGGEA